MALGGPIVSLLFERGQFGAAATAATTEALAAYAVGLPAFSATRIAAQTFYALADTHTPVVLGFVSVAANVVLALGLMWPLAHAGLALASSLAAYVNLLALLWMLRRRLGPMGGRALGPVADSPGHTAAWTGVAVVGGGLAFVAAAALLRAPELHALLAMLRRGKGLPPPGGW